MGSPTPRKNVHYTIQAMKILGLGVIVVGCLFGLNQLQLSSLFPIKNVRIYGIQRLDQQEVRELLHPLIDEGFFSIDVENIHDHLIQLPWVADSFVRRYWPDQIEIIISERHAIAEWNDRSLLSENGELFSPDRNSYPLLLPKFVGPDGKQMVMLQYFHVIDRLLQPLHAKILQLELTPYSTWRLTLNNGIAMELGHKDILTRLQHFVKVYPKIIGDHAKDVEYVDLRYPNGVAIRWKVEHT